MPSVSQAIATLWRSALASRLDSAEARGWCSNCGPRFFANAISENLAAGSAVGVTGTPSFFIGKTGKDGSIEGINVKGSQPIASFRQVIDGLIESN